MPATWPASARPTSWPPRPGWRRCCTSRASFGSSAAQPGQQGPQAGLLPVGVLLAALARQPRLLRPQTPRGPASPSGPDPPGPPTDQRAVGDAAQPPAIPARPRQGSLTTTLGCITTARALAAEAAMTPLANPVH